MTKLLVWTTPSGRSSRYKLLKPLDFLIGVWFEALIPYVLLSVSKGIRTPSESTTSDIIYAITIMMIGLLANGLFLSLWQIALYATDEISAFALALAILSFIMIAGINSGLGPRMFARTLSVVGVIVTMCLQKPITILGAVSVAGSNGVCDLVLATLRGDGMTFTGNQWEVIKVGGFALLALSGIFVQYAITRQMKRGGKGKYLTLENERAPGMVALRQ
ncbi:hypothetical protein BDK51DRAFT_35297 [Blyttiomyces helicus]|uniref:Uncharacterized protein n=1 Tax=Blyttiomyces helicus TaxID=388810 RepID=A0A4P9WK54_9FUNG|nr:hypothetical protein BDK51DRAFT_35297 [Blyttiomyces helicus]|eukprot:RKO92772.1 hypothetical protein BDK51DRAFT_35297 [Blyttiomyces helicus]